MPQTTTLPRAPHFANNNNNNDVNRYNNNNNNNNNFCYRSSRPVTGIALTFYFITEMWKIELRYIRQYQPMILGWLGTKAVVSVTSPKLIEVRSISYAITVAVAKALTTQNIKLSDLESVSEPHRPSGHRTYFRKLFQATTNSLHIYHYIYCLCV
jgi:hypothetical protein